MVSVQKGPGTDQLVGGIGNLRNTSQQDAGQIARPPHFGPILDLGNRLDANGAFLDTAAVMVNLDLVIGADTAIVHLAGALGVPCWLGLSLFPYDWRWLVGREDSPWYPNMRVFRQTVLDNWTEVFARMASALRQQRGIPEPAPEITIPVPPGELIDKLTILAIKSERITDAAKLTNVRAAGSDENIILIPPRRFTLEQAIDYIQDDELIEVTPDSIRMRKRYLTENERKRKS